MPNSGSSPQCLWKPPAVEVSSVAQGHLIMPLLSDIDEKTLAARLPASSAVADNVPLVHVDRTMIDLIEHPPHEIPTSAMGSNSDNTRRAEELLGLPHSAYFYAGRAHPKFGSTAFAFAAGCEVAHTGSVSPFDTGGLLSNPPHLKLRLKPNDGEAERAAFGKASMLPLDQWRATFGRFLAAYFETDVDYWQKKPSRFDPERLFELNNDWRAWTFEIRFSEGQSIHERAAWCADETVMSQLRRLDDQQPATIPGDPPSGLDKFFAGPPALEPTGTPQFCERLEQWVREQIEV